MKVNFLHSYRRAGLPAASLFALAAALPVAAMAGVGDLADDQNIIRVTGQAVSIEDSESSFQAATQHAKSGLYGIEELRFTQALGDDGKLTAKLQLLPGSNTYDNTIKVSYDEKGSAEIGYKQFRTFYDGVGGFFPTNGAWKPLADQMLHVDRSKFWIGATISLPDKPVISLRYTNERRWGKKDSTVWGETDDTGIPIWSRSTLNPVSAVRDIVPGSIDIDEQVQTFEASLRHVVGKTKFDLSVVGTFVNNENTRWQSRYPGEVKPYPAIPSTPAVLVDPSQANNANYGYDTQGIDSQTFAFMGRFETELSSKVSLFGGFNYSTVNADISGERQVWIDLATTQGVVSAVGGFTTGGRPPYSYTDLAGNADHRAFNANLGVHLRPIPSLFITAALKGESVKTDSDNSLTFTSTLVSPANGSTTPVNNGAINYSRADEDVWVPELSVRYNGIRGVSLYATSDYRVSPGSETQYNQSVSSNGNVSKPADSTTKDVTENHFNGKAGFRWSPSPYVTLGGEVFAKNHANSFTNALDSETRFVLDSETKGGTVSATVTPVPAISLTTRYVYRKGSMETSVDNMASFESMDSAVHQISQAIAWSPNKDVYVQGNLGYVFDTTITIYPRSGATSNMRLHNADSNYWTASLVGGFNLNQDTKLEVQYSTYKSNNYLAGLNYASLAYGAEQRDQNLTLGVKHKFSDKLAGEAKVGYFQSTNTTSGHNTDYKGILGYVSVVHAF